jgi:tetratricopeptide (TPR) repeat protein
MNTERFEQFEDYLTNKMSEKERLLFEEQLARDEDMRTDFGVYAKIEEEMKLDPESKAEEQALKESLARLNTAYFNAQHREEAPTVPITRNNTWNYIMGIAAASVVFLAAYFVFFHSVQDVNQMAGEYFTSRYEQLGQTMGSTEDLMQQGISAYNKQDFEAVLDENPQHYQAKLNIGLSYLSMQEWENALSQFGELAERQDLFQNEGRFLQAVTYLKRNEEGDNEKAKPLLEEVVERNLFGVERAKEWLKKL